MPKIIPAIIPKDAKDLKDKLEIVKGLADTVHIDFVLPLKGVLRLQSEGGIFFEAHLMLPHPEEYITDMVKAGFARVLVHVRDTTSPASLGSAPSSRRESINSSLEGGARRAEDVSPEAFAELIHEWNGSVEIGAVLEIETPIDSIDSFAHELKTVQLMSIAHIGKQGEPFDPRVIPRVAALHAKYPHLTISIDGGVNKENAEQLAAAGATRLVVGSHINEFYAR